MLGVHVSSEVHFPLERFATRRATEWFEPGVFPAVGDEVGRLAEGFATMSTFVRFLSCKDKNLWGDISFVI